MKRGAIILLADIIILTISFYFFVFLKYDTLLPFSELKRSIIYFNVLWVVVSLITGKYQTKRIKSFRDILSIITFCNLIVLGFSVILIKISVPFLNYRFIIIYSIFLSTILELFFGYLLALAKNASESPFYMDKPEESKSLATGENVQAEVQSPAKPVIEKEILPDITSYIDLNSIIIEETDPETLNLIRNYFSPRIADTLIISTTTVFNLYNQPRPKYEVIINLKRINDIQYISKFFEAVNSKLVTGGLFIDWVETYSQRKSRILSKYPWGLNYIYYTIDFIIKRVFPKLNFTKKLYFLITRGQNRVLSKAETFGRLYSCGFEIVEERFINNKLFFIFRKVKEPLFDYHPTYGPIIKLKRIGKNGKIIGVFKFRTMHAYSEYLQDYIYKMHNLDEGGKFKNDFRVTTLGRIFRILWLDEFPMLFNVFIFRNMKIVGVRPLSQHYFSLYSEELKRKRIKFKPGLIPPFYAQYPTPKTLEEIQENEMKYLEEYEKTPVKTDFKYFGKALYNIIINRVRSR